MVNVGRRVGELFGKSDVVNVVMDVLTVEDEDKVVVSVLVVEVEGKVDGVDGGWVVVDVVVEGSVVVPVIYVVDVRILDRIPIIDVILQS